MKHKNKLAKIRKEKKMTQAQLAKQVGVSITQIQYIEYGKNAPSIYFAQRIAKALNAEVGELFPIED